MPSRFSSRLIRTLLVAPALVLPVAACYSAVPVANPQPTRGTPLVVELTDKGTYDLTSRIGASTRTVQGRLVAADDSTLTLAVTGTTDIRGIPTSWTGEEIAFRRDYLARVSERRLSRTRSWLLAGGLLALAAIAGGIALEGGGGGSSDGGNTQ